MKTKEIYIFLFVLCALVYANAVPVEFVSDDIDDIMKSPLIGRLKIFLFSPHNLLNSLIYLGFQDKTPVPYHIASILLHGVMTVLVYIFLTIFFNRRASLLGAALFAVHPIHVEAVTWISGRPYIFLGVISLGTFLMYYKATSAPKSFQSGVATPDCNPGLKKELDWRWYAGSLVLFTYYIYRNYAFYFMMPVMLLCFDVIFERIKKTWKWLMPYFVILAGRLVLSRMDIVGRVDHVAKQMEEGFVWTNPLFNMVYSLYTHLGLVAWPGKLTLYHEPPVITVFWLRLGIIGLIVTAFILGATYKKAKPLCFGICIFGIFLAPTYSPVTISWLLAERYAYVPSIFLSILLAFLYQKYIMSFSKLKRVGLALCALFIAGYAVRTITRNEDWRTPDRLWRATVIVSPQSPRAHNNMGDLYAHEGNYGKAIESFKKAVELKPNYADGYHNLANIYEITGNNEPAIQNYAKAIQLNPELYQSYQRLALIYDTIGDKQLAGQLLDQAEKIKRDLQARGNAFVKGPAVEVQK